MTGVRPDKATWGVSSSSKPSGFWTCEKFSCFCVNKSSRQRKRATPDGLAPVLVPAAWSRWQAKAKVPDEAHGFGSKRMAQRGPAGVLWALSITSFQHWLQTCFVCTGGKVCTRWRPDTLCWFCSCIHTVYKIGHFNAFRLLCALHDAVIMFCSGSWQKQNARLTRWAWANKEWQTNRKKQTTT